MSEYRACSDASRCSEHCSARPSIPSGDGGVRAGSSCAPSRGKHAATTSSPACSHLVAARILWGRR
jgi:hypothetical protein